MVPKSLSINFSPRGVEMDAIPSKKWLHDLPRIREPVPHLDDLSMAPVLCLDHELNLLIAFPKCILVLVVILDRRQESNNNHSAFGNNPRMCQNLLEETTDMGWRITLSKVVGSQDQNMDLRAPTSQIHVWFDLVNKSLGNLPTPLPVPFRSGIPVLGSHLSFQKFPNLIFRSTMGRGPNFEEFGRHDFKIRVVGRSKNHEMKWKSFEIQK